ncbi:MAG: hypothetical protein AB7J47_16020 [Acidimicrobiia bacterium]
MLNSNPYLHLQLVREHQDRLRREAGASRLRREHRRLRPQQSR